MTDDPLITPPWSAGELNRQYDNRAAVVEHPAFLAHWAESSAALRAGWRDWETLRYAPGERRTLDLFRCSRGGAPLQIFLHGGYWQTLAKDSFSFVAKPWLGANVNVAVVNYPLCPAVSLDQLVQSVRLACLFLWRHGPDLGFDRTRMQISGHSAGGHLVAMMLATDWPALADDVSGRLIHSAVSLSGLFLLDPLRFTYVNEALGMDAECARRNSPALLARIEHCPTLLAAGALESAEYHRQSAALTAAWSGTAPPPARSIIPGCHHFSVLDPWTNETSELFRTARGWLASASVG